jgi:hypothetical protein
MMILKERERFAFVVQALTALPAAYFFVLVRCFLQQEYLCFFVGQNCLCLRFHFALMFVAVPVALFVLLLYCLFLQETLHHVCFLPELHLYCLYEQYDHCFWYPYFCCLYLHCRCFLQHCYLYVKMSW